VQSLGIDANNPIEVTQTNFQDGEIPFPFPLDDALAWDDDGDEYDDGDNDDDDYDDDYDEDPLKTNNDDELVIESKLENEENDENDDKSYDEAVEYDYE
jgi:hypothetical protein